jgi:hypothetical protein
MFLCSKRNSVLEGTQALVIGARAPSTVEEEKMGKEQEKKAVATPDEFFVFGIDDAIASEGCGEQ